MEKQTQLKLLSGSAKYLDFSEKLRQHLKYPLVTRGISVLQLNICRKCNLNCVHCHVEAQNNSQEIMNDRILKKCVEIAEFKEIETIDITGGSPEMHPNLSLLLNLLSKLNKRVIVRSNGAILVKNEYREYVDLYASLGIERSLYPFLLIILIKPRNKEEKGCFLK